MLFRSQLECDRSMAVDMCEHTPNGLLYCLIGEHFPLVYANQSLCDILGFKDFSELIEYTKGQMDRCIYQADLELLKQVLLSFSNGVPYTINYRVLTKQGQVKWVMERGRYVLDAETGEEYYICTIIPLELEQEDFAYGNLVDYTYIENAPLSVERFLEQTLAYMDFHDRPAVCQKLLQHCCETLQASCGVVSIIHEGSKKIEPLYYYDKKNFPIDFILSNFYWEDIAPYFTEDGFSLCVSEGLPMLTCLFETASAVGTVGLSLGITPELNLLSRSVLILLMFFGRVGGLTLIFAALSSAQKKVSKLPKEKITVG